MTLPLHLSTGGAEYGSRCCECGHVLGRAARLVGYDCERLVWTPHAATYASPPPGFHQCTATSPTPSNEAPVDRRGVQARAVSSTGCLMCLWREANANMELWGRIRGAIAPVCHAAGVDPDHEDVGLHLGEALLARPPAPFTWGVYMNPCRVWVSHGLMSRLPSHAWPFSEFVAPAAVVLAVPGADWRRHPGTLREACEAAASICLAEGFCLPVERKS